MSILEELVKKLPWEEGRQKTGYKKIKLLESERLNFDCYLLYYPEGSEIPQHFDKVESGRHYRMNIVLKKADVGGDFVCQDVIFSKYRTNIFRPDIAEHSVTKIEKGYRLVLSIGWLKE